MISVTDWSTEMAVRRAKEYERLGADALMLLPPFYFNPDVSEIRNHMIRVLEAVEIPVVLQYAPQATGCHMPEQELIDMAERYPHAAFKIEYKPARDYLAAFLRQKSDMTILTGYAGLEMVDLYELGVAGVMPACSFPELYVEITRRFISGDLPGARALYAALEKYLVSWMLSPESLLAIEKEILTRRGWLASGACRRPAYRLTKENQREIDAFLQEFAPYLS